MLTIRIIVVEEEEEEEANKQHKINIVSTEPTLFSQTQFMCGFFLSSLSVKLLS